MHDLSGTGGQGNTQHQGRIYDSKRAPSLGVRVNEWVCGRAVCADRQTDRRQATHSPLPPRRPADFTPPRPASNNTHTDTRITYTRQTDRHKSHMDKTLLLSLKPITCSRCLCHGGWMDGWIMCLAHVSLPPDRNGHSLRFTHTHISIRNGLGCAPWPLRARQGKKVTGTHTYRRVQPYARHTHKSGLRCRVCAHLHRKDRPVPSVGHPHFSPQSGRHRSTQVGEGHRHTQRDRHGGGGRAGAHYSCTRTQITHSFIQVILR